MSKIDFLKNKYHTMSLPAKASVWFMITSLINRGISFITTPFFTRLLFKEDYGTASLYNTWLAVIAIFATFELAAGVFNKAMIKYKEDRDAYTSATLFLSSVLTIAVFLIYILFHDFWNSLIGLSTPLMIMMFADIFLTTAWSFFSVRNRFEFKYKSIVIITIITNILATVCSIIFTVLADQYKVEAKVVGLLVVRVIVYGTVYIYLLIKGKKLISGEYWKYSLWYNLPLIPHYLSQQVLNQSDRIMIDNMCGKADAGVYSLAYQLAIVMQIVTNAIHASFMPWSYQCLDAGEEKKIGARAFQIEIIVGIMCLLFSLFAPEVIWILGGEEYYIAVYIVPPVSMSILFLTMYSFFGNIEFYFEKTKFVMIASCFVAVVNIVLNYIFISIFGFIAAGYTTLACYMGYCTIHYIFMKKVCADNGLDNPFPGKKMWLVALIFAIISVGISVIYTLTVLRYILIVFITIICINYFIKNKDIILIKKQ